ncbi:hypothetical protein EVG20_g7660 [Dentipellis fragilis]|uniref:Uncharacterized protein n=1 Tax=Dentipellis fragilis TaxID=205917 RepID=A0A4Y9YEB6_9AGAM|nr:hypothetical protein EVG20_g7660 [Dentipellis fragilis]
MHCSWTDIAVPEVERSCTAFTFDDERKHLLQNAEKDIIMVFRLQAQILYCTSTESALLFLVFEYAARMDSSLHHFRLAADACLLNNAHTYTTPLPNSYTRRLQTGRVDCARDRSRPQGSRARRHAPHRMGWRLRARVGPACTPGAAHRAQVLGPPHALCDNIAVPNRGIALFASTGSAHAPA